MSAALEPLPPKPEPPRGYDCCGGGCADCELTAYVRALARWKKLKAEHEAQGATPAPD